MWEEKCGENHSQAPSCETCVYPEAPLCLNAIYCLFLVLGNSPQFCRADKTRLNIEYSQLHVLNGA